MRTPRHSNIGSKEAGESDRSGNALPTHFFLYIVMFVSFIRALILYPIVVFGVRLMGKRQIGELQPTELVITILISNIASLPLEDQNLPLLMGISMERRISP